MTDTPIIDAVCDAYSNGNPVYEDDRASMQDAIMTLMPWEPTQEWIDAVTNWGAPLAPSRPAPSGIANRSCANSTRSVSTGTKREASE
jgi:hypothetical protein